MLRFRALFEYIESGVKKMGFSYSKNMTKFGSVLLENYFKRYKPLICSTIALSLHKNFFPRNSQIFSVCTITTLRL